MIPFYIFLPSNIHDIKNNRFRNGFKDAKELITTCQSLDEEYYIVITRGKTSIEIIDCVCQIFTTLTDDKNFASFTTDASSKIEQENKIQTKITQSFQRHFYLRRDRKKDINLLTLSLCDDIIDLF